MGKLMDNVAASRLLGNIEELAECASRLLEDL